MSILNVVNTPAKQAARNTLTRQFNNAIQAIAEINVSEGAEFIKLLKKTFAERYKAIDSEESINLDAEISTAKKTRTPRNKSANAENPDSHDQDDSVDTDDEETITPAKPEAKPATSNKKGNGKNKNTSIM